MRHRCATLHIAVTSQQHFTCKLSKTAMYLSRYWPPRRINNVSMYDIIYLYWFVLVYQFASYNFFVITVLCIKESSTKYDEYENFPLEQVCIRKSQFFPHNCFFGRTFPFPSSSFRPINYSQVIISSVSQTSLILGQPYFPLYYPH